MNDISTILIFIATFAVIAVASKQISQLFVKIKLPQITGFLLMGIIAGPFFLNLIKEESIKELNFIKETSLAFIAFAAGAELYLKELRSRFKSITWMTFGQLVVTFVLSTIIILFIADYIPFISDASFAVRFATAILISTIFVARSPASAIAVINEVRAKGPFTQTVMGVTVIKDVLVIILFAICFSLSKTLIAGDSFDYKVILLIFFEILLSFGFGFLFGKFLAFILSFNLNTSVKTILILAAGYGIYVLSDEIKFYSEEFFGFEMYLEPLLICIVGSFVVTNYSGNKLEFNEIIHNAGPVVYVSFFTLTGTSVSIDIFLKSWVIALIFFTIRLVTMTLGAYLGGKAGGDPVKYWKFGWMPYVTQAGVALGLVTVVSGEFTNMGQEFATVLISVIMMNELIGPLLFKWVLNYVGESHQRAVPSTVSGERNAIIFGLENQSLALGRQLKTNNWNVTIATRRSDFKDFLNPVINIKKIEDFSYKTFKELKAAKVEAIVAMNTDEENFAVCETAYEKFGTKDMIVRLNDRKNFEKFHKLGALIVEPTTAIVSLLDHFVRSPVAASLLLGLEENHSTIDIEIGNKNVHGLALRQLRLPGDILILSINRNGNTVLSHGYTLLRVGDIITVVGSNESLEKMKLRFEK